MVLTYTLVIDKPLNMKKKYILDKLKFVLSSNKGWKKHGYNFKYIDTVENCDIIVHMSTNAFINKRCGVGDKLSCAEYNKNIKNKGNIYLNVERWRKGSSASKLNLQEYRNYQLNHEFGHILGRDHVFHKDYINKKCPIMVQQTLGIGKSKVNCWPLYFE